MEERRINLDEYGNALLTKEEGKTALLHGHNITGAVITDDKEVELYNEFSKKLLGKEDQISFPIDGIDVAEYHDLCTQVWNIPTKYKTLDMESYLLSLCKNEEQTARVKLEYAMFEERDLVPLLQFLTYIVDYMRENEIVWGVGRGSSVASYCLYLLGVHKVDSIKYDLPIEEFLK
jgi:DNA polymerase III alpha subunit